MTDPLDAQRRDDLARSLSISHSGPILEANDWRPLAGNVLYLIRQAEQAARKKALEEAAQCIADKVKLYPVDIFIPPPAGEHGKTVDACSAAALRAVAPGWADSIRDLSEET